MSSDSSDSEIEFTPPKKEAKLVKENLLSARSLGIYIRTYENFMLWKSNNKSNTFTETVFLEYFSELAKTKKPSSLWSIYSMLKSTVHIKNGIDMHMFTNLKSFLKKQSEGFESKKSKTFTSADIKQFLNEAPDHKYLAMKVALILGISGACHSSELCNITTKDIKCLDDIIVITMPNAKTKTDRTFFVSEELLTYVKKYLELRPIGTVTDRFFLNYKNGKCIKQVIGKNQLAVMPKEIATYLNLPDPQNYTGRCFRRSSTTLLADSGANLFTLKRHAGWESDKMVESYVKDSMENKSSSSSNARQPDAELNEEVNITSKESLPGPLLVKVEPVFTDDDVRTARQPDAELNEEVNITSKESLPGPLLVKVEPVFTDDDVRTGDAAAVNSRWRNGYRCSSCAGLIVSKFRYACVQCPDFDLCGACEARGEHAAHYVLRIPPCRPFKEIEAVLRKIRSELPLTSTNVVIKIEAEPPQAEVDPLTTQAPDGSDLDPLRKIKTEELEVFIEEHELPPAGSDERPSWPAGHILPDLPARQPAQVACLDRPETSHTSKTQDVPHRPHAHTSVAVLPKKQKPQNDLPSLRPQKPQAHTSMASLPIKQTQVDAPTYPLQTPQTDISMTDVPIKQEIEIDIPLELNHPSTDNQVVPAVKRKRESLKTLRLEAKLEGASTAPMSDGSSLEEHTRAAKKKKV